MSTHNDHLAEQAEDKEPEALTQADIEEIQAQIDVETISFRDEFGGEVITNQKEEVKMKDVTYEEPLEKLPKLTFEVNEPIKLKVLAIREYTSQQYGESHITHFETEDGNKRHYFINKKTQSLQALYNAKVGDMFVVNKNPPKGPKHGGYMIFAIGNEEWLNPNLIKSIKEQMELYK